jgi:hypothetical protein
MAKKEKKLSFFDIVSNINAGPKAKDLLEDVTAHADEAVSLESPEKAYVPFMVNRSLSFFNDTVLFANEMNRYASLPAKMQYDFYRNALRPRKRFSKWFKALPDTKDIEVIKEHYGYSSEKAREVLPLFTPSALAELHKLRDKGGHK